MKSFYYLPEAHKTAYFDGRNKSKSPLNNFRKTPPRNVFENSKKNNIPGVTFSSKNNKKQQTSKYNTPITPQRKLYYSHNNSQIVQFFKNNHAIDNIEQQITPIAENNIEEQYFSASLCKIGEIRRKYYTATINSQLDQVLNMIKQQKLKISEKMKILKRNNQYYTHKYEGRVAETSSRATNTDQLLDQGLEKSYNEQQVQVNEEQLEQKTVHKQSQTTAGELAKSTRDLQKQKEYYLKLCNMLDQMKINHQQILPQLHSLQKIISKKEYKVLGDAQVIKIQKFFITKLAAKLHNN